MKEVDTTVENSSTPHIIHLEDEYPLIDRRKEGFKLIGFREANISLKRLAYYPYGKIPVYRYLGWDKGKKYDGEALREIRKKNGV